MPGKYIVPPQYQSEPELVSAAQRGSHRAIEHLVVSHQPIRSLIATLTRSIDPERRATDDLEGAARLAILEALRSFDPARGVRFPTYAYYFIRGAMLKTLYPAAERCRRDGEVSRIKFVSLEEPGENEFASHAGSEDDLLKSDPEYGIDPGYARAEDSACAAGVRRFVAALAPNQRTIVTAVFWDGQTHSQLALERAISRPAITRTLQRVYARGEKELAEYRLELAA
jgi:RNA polymerase sigma factor (sigma-70 family)